MTVWNLKWGAFAQELGLEYEKYKVLTGDACSVVVLVIPQDRVPEFKRLLVAYYEDRDNGEIMEFMRSCCWRTF